MTPPRRRVTANARRHSLLVFVEGAKTEVSYLKHWSRRHRFEVTVEIDPLHGTPLALVQKAAKAKKRNERDAKRGRGPAHDEVWCVFDVDKHPHLDEAIALAAEAGVDLAISNPCIELWFLLHFDDQTAHLDRGKAQSECRKHLKCDKSLTKPALAALDEHYERAKNRAVGLDKRHHGDGTEFPDNNPSTRVWKLVDAISTR